MNYRHSFHAGNFADVMKHVVLARIVDYLKRKDAAFRVIDTHAGAGMYDLAGEASGRTGESAGGIGRLDAIQVPADVQTILAPYFDALAAARAGGATLYPGSPWIARHLLRQQDRLSALELHPEEAASLRTLFAGDVQVRVNELDGWLALGAHVPPKEKRGLVLVDPPFEIVGEFDRLVDGAVKANRRWQGGVMALWYPIKDGAAVEAFRARLKASGIPKMLDLQLMIRTPSGEPRLDGSGMIVVNPPYTLEAEMKIALPWLARVLQMDDGARSEAVWLAP